MSEQLVHYPRAVDPAEITDELAFAGDEPETWSNPAGYRWHWHSHSVAKRVYCLEGHVMFHTVSGDIALEPGDRLDIPEGALHAATVGGSGVTCVEVIAPPVRLVE